MRTVAPLFWVPTLSLTASSANARFLAPLALAFLASHRGRGHIVLDQDAPVPGQSVSTRVPAAGRFWRSAGPLPFPPPAATAGVEVVLECPFVGKGPPLGEAGPESVRRVIVVRRPASGLAEIDRSVSRLLEALAGGPDIWLDQPSFGFDALSYLADRYPALQIDNVGDGDLYDLLQLGELIDRPVWLWDFSGRPPLPLPAPPRYPLPDPPPVKADDLPISKRFL